MYRLKPLVKIEDPVSSSTSMYKMKRLFTFGAPTTTTTTTTDSAPVECALPSTQELAEEDLLLKDLKDDEVTALKGLRDDQIRMLSTLDELRQQVDALKARVGVDQLPKDVLQAIEASLTASASTAAAAAAAGPPSIDDVVIRDIVVCAHPDRPPLAILVYFELLKQFFKVTGSVHTHSSCAAGAVSKSLSGALEGSSFVGGIASGVSSRAAFDLALTLIWKDVARGSEMMVAPHRQAKIRGDAAICRYLARICQPYDAEGCDAVRATEIDAWTDAANCTSEKELAAHLKSLSSRLSGSRHWIVGDALSLADVANWALVRSSPFLNKQPLPPNVESWRKRCQDRPEFQLAERVASRSKKR